MKVLLITNPENIDSPTIEKLFNGKDVTVCNYNDYLQYAKDRYDLVVIVGDSHGMHELILLNLIHMGYTTDQLFVIENAIMFLLYDPTDE